MLRRTRWRVVEEEASPATARAMWARARGRGATGAVTSWGSGMPARETVRVFWEVVQGRGLPEGEDLVEENWTPYWRESLGPVRVTDRLTLVPAWESPPEGAGGVLRIDPGMAFGAGDHPTTRLCLRALEALADAKGLPDRVLDVGTGTGVLALAAAALGARRVDALDIDPFGYAACRRNARLNGLEEAVRPVLLSLDLLEGRYPLVLANVVGSQIVALAGELRAHTEPGGRVIASGFQADEEPRVLEALGLAREQRLEEEGWVAWVLRSEGRR